MIFDIRKLLGPRPLLSAGPSHANARRLWIGLLFSCLAALIRFHQLDGQSLWNDEMFSIDIGRMPFSEIQPQLIAHYHHPPLYFYLVHVVFSVLGESAWSLRWLSALCGSLTVGAVFYCSSSMFGIRAGLIAGTLCLFSPFHLAYAQEGRPYALAALLALLCCMFYAQILVDKKPVTVVSYCFTSIALVYTHHWGIFVLLSQLLFTLFVVKSEPGLKRYLIGISITLGLAYVPELYAIYRQSITDGGVGWWWAERPNGSEVIHIVEAYAGSYFKMASAIFILPGIIRFFGALSFVSVVLVGIDAVARRPHDTGMRGLFLCCAATLIIPFGLSFVKPEIFLWYRYTIIVFPLVCVLVAGATAHGRWRIPADAAVIVLAAIGMYGTVMYFSWSKSSAREVAHYVAQVTDDTVHIIIRPAYAARLLNYYYSGKAVQLDEAYLNTPLGEIVDTAHSFAYISLDTPNEIRNYMDRHFEKIAAKEFAGEAHMGMIVGLYKQKPEPDDSTSSDENLK